MALTKPLQLDKLYKWSKVAVVLPECTRGTVTNDKPDPFNHGHDEMTPVRLDISTEVHWVWNWILRPLDVLESLSEI